MARARSFSNPMNPRAEFEALKPAFDTIIKLQTTVRPYGPDYIILTAVTKAMGTAAFHFLRDPNFFGSKPHG
ncbi:MAG: hypothetical protein E7812_18740 [Phenylobacterium sp.]|nr:MAG: hypothetical protein E7812_18740 [Phenylobacterium sp.]